MIQCLQIVNNDDLQYIGCHNHIDITTFYLDGHYYDLTMNQNLELPNFQNVDQFVSHNCAYWNYAYLDENGWVDVDDEGDEIKWVSSFFERFIEPLKENDKITIYEFSRSSN